MNSLQLQIEDWKNPFKIPKLLANFLIFAEIFNIISHIAILELESYNYFNSELLKSDSVFLILAILLVYVCNALPQNFRTIFLENQTIFYSKENRNIFLSQFEKKTKLLILRLIGWIIAIIDIILLIIYYNPNQLPMVNEWLDLSGTGLIISYINYGISLLFYIILLKFLPQGIWIIFTIFKSISLLATKKHPLKISYNDLKVGILNKIGQFTISISIPLLFFSTFISIVFTKSFESPNIGFQVAAYSMVSLGIIMDIFFALLLYKSTIHIHNAIVEFKLNFFTKINNEIESELNKSVNSNYENIFHLNSAYGDIQRIQDWPFNPTSLKKLGVTVASTFLPVFLSFFGI